jgi:hypothetical protein
LIGAAGGGPLVLAKEPRIDRHPSNLPFLPEVAA